MVGLAVARSYALGKAIDRMHPLLEALAPLEAGRFAAAIEEIRNRAAAEGLVEDGGAVEEAIGIAIAAPLWGQGLGARAPALPNAGDGPTIAFFAWAAEQTETAPGALVRGVPLYLAEAFRLESTAQPVTVVPVVPDRGLVRWREAPSGDQLVELCPADRRFAVTGLVRGDSTATLTVHDLQAKTTRSLALRGTTPHELALAAKRRLFERFASEARFETRAPPASLAPGSADLSTAYLTGLENLSVQLLVLSRHLPRAAVWNEAHAYAGFIGLMSALPALTAPKLMALASLLAGMRYDPESVAPYEELIRTLAGS